MRRDRADSPINDHAGARDAVANRPPSAGYQSKGCLRNNGTGEQQSAAAKGSDTARLVEVHHRPLPGLRIIPVFALEGSYVKCKALRG